MIIQIHLTFQWFEIANFPHISFNEALNKIPFPPLLPLHERNHYECTCKSSRTLPPLDKDAWSHSDYFNPLKTEQSNQGIWQTQIILNTLVLSGMHILVYTNCYILLWYGFTILNNDFSIIHLCIDIISYCQHNTDKYVSIINWWQVIDAVGMHNSFNLTAIQLSLF